VKPRHRQGIDFRNQDMRFEVVEPSFDLILCRYVAFTYFALPLQQRVLLRILDHLLPNGYLAIGIHERPPVKETPLILRLSRRLCRSE
jgi:chemotaxis protein methyltransferase CheR